MGNELDPFLCEDVDDSKYYVVEVEAFEGGSGVTGCSRPSIGYYHEATDGHSVEWWICDEMDCKDGYTLIGALGDCQRLLRVFGPWDTMTEAQLNVW